MAQYARDLETMKVGEKLKTPLKLQFTSCEEDPNAFIDVVIIYQKREEKSGSSRMTTA